MDLGLVKTGRKKKKKYKGLFWNNWENVNRNKKLTFLHKLSTVICVAYFQIFF